MVTNDNVLVKVYLQQIENSIQSLGRYINILKILLLCSSIKVEHFGCITILGNYLICNFCKLIFLFSESTISVLHRFDKHPYKMMN